MSKKVFERSKRVLSKCMEDDRKYVLSEDARMRGNFVFVRAILKGCMEYNESMTVLEIHELMEMAYKGALDEQ